MDTQVIEADVFETEQQVVELSLADLAAVGGGMGDAHIF